LLEKKPLEQFCLLGNANTYNELALVSKENYPFILIYSISNTQISMDQPFLLEKNLESNFAYR
jgi:hypothetical protein